MKCINIVQTLGRWYSARLLCQCTQISTYNVQERHAPSIGFCSCRCDFCVWILFVLRIEVGATAKRWKHQEVKAWKWQLVYTASGYDWRCIMVILYNPESSITQHTHQCACRLSGLLKLWIRLNKLVNHHLLGMCCCCLFSRVSLYGAVVASNLWVCTICKMSCALSLGFWLGLC